MAYDELLADRLRDVLHTQKVIFEEKKMMGGLCIMVDHKMCVGIIKNQLMARVGPGAYEHALTKEGCTKMTFTGKPLKGYVYVTPDAVDLESDLQYWVELCLEFNPMAIASKKKKKSQ